MKFLDLYFSATDRAALAAALAPHGIDCAERSGGEGWALDYVGLLVQTPATLDATQFPPVELSPAVLFDGDRANLRLFGVSAEKTASALYFATLPQGVAVLKGADIPDAQRTRWGDSGFPFGDVSAAQLSQPEAVAAFIVAARDGAQAMLDAKATEYGYDNILSACTYAEEPSVPRFQAEGIAFRSWRSQVWAACYAALNAHDPAQPLPLLSDFLAALPAFTPPAP